MKILIVHNAGRRASVSGELCVAENEAAALQKHGVEAELKVVYNEATGCGKLRQLFLLAINIFWSFSAYRQMNQWLDLYAPDIVHFHGVLPRLTASVFYACRRRGIGVVQTLHNFRWLCVEGGLFRNNGYCDQCLTGVGWPGAWRGCAKKSRPISLILVLINLFYRRTHRLFRWADKFIAVSEFVKHEYKRAGFPSEKIVVKYNGIDISDASLPGDNPRAGIIFVGRLSAAKGTDTLKFLIAKIKTTFHIVGHGPELAELKRLCLANGLTHVNFHGALDRTATRKLLAASRCVIIPSRCGETFSLVAAEAMAVGTPIIAGAVGGVKEIVEKAQAGMTVDYRDNEKWVAAVETLVADDEKMKSYGANGKKFAEQNFNIEETTRQLIQIYRSIRPAR